MRQCTVAAIIGPDQTELAVSGPANDEVAAIRNRLAALRAEQTALQARLAELDADDRSAHADSLDAAPVTATSSPAEKVALFRSLFRGREDVFPKRWSNARSGRSGYAPACANEWVPRVCDRPRIKCRECPNQAFIPVTAEVIARHLQGRGPDGRDFTIGVYPMLADETCWFLAIDFDKKTWHRDVAVFLATCRALGLPAALERSRSGNGGHVWIFFTHPVPAASARRLGAWLVTESMEQNPDIGFDSYDRLFPSQDRLPAGGFGNLIALPLQHRPRQAGNSVFLDDDFQPHADQWSYLSSVRRMTPAEVAGLTDAAGRRGRILGVRLPVTEEDDAPWLAPPSRKRPEAPITGPLPETVEVVLGDQVYVGRADLPAPLVNRLARLAAFQNPEFYSAQGMRLPTYGIRRVIGCAELLSHHVAVPRGCRDQVEAALSALDIVVRTRDERNRGRPLETTFEGELTREQDAAADALLRHDTGVLAATTAFGKTVVAAALIAARGTNLHAVRTGAVPRRCPPAGRQAAVQPSGRAARHSLRIARGIGSRSTTDSEHLRSSGQRRRAERADCGRLIRREGGGSVLQGTQPNGFECEHILPGNRFNRDTFTGQFDLTDHWRHRSLHGSTVPCSRF